MALTSLVLPACRRGPDGSLPAAYRRLDVPEARLASAQAIARGEASFTRYCAICHGPRGAGDGLQSEGLVPPPTDLSQTTWRASTSPREVFFVIREGVHGTAMPSWKSLGEDEAWDLTAFVLSLGGQ